MLLAGLPGAVIAQGRSDPVSFFWYIIPGTQKCELFASGHKIGLWDADTEKYYRVNDNGSLIGPIVPPWQTRPGSATTKARPVTKSAPTMAPTIDPPPSPGKPAGVASSGEKPWYQAVPPWAGYVVGGLLTALVTGVGLAIQIRTSKR